MLLNRTKLFLFLLTIGFVCQGYSQNKGYVKDEIQLQASNEIKNEKKTGYWVEYHPNGNIKSTGEYKKGKPTGFWKIYSKDGKFYNQGEFKKGEAIGWWYFTHAETGTKLDGLKYNGKGQCIGHATMRW